MNARRWALSSVVLSLAVAAGRAQDANVFKSISAEQTEKLLESMKIDFKKKPAAKEGLFYYDFQRGGHSLRLYWFGGKDLMLDVVFAKMPLEQVNTWNVRAKFSRACLHKDAKGEFVALEANLDILGGVTEGTVKQFIQVFDDEVKAFAKFVGASTGDERIYTKVAPDKLEAILKDLNVEFKKAEVKGGVLAYDFESNKHRLRLVSFGGDDIMIDAHFKKLPLADVNQYNLNRKFIRCVAYNMNGTEYTALEANLDCAGGVSDGIVRHFIRAFDAEVQEFSKYVQGK